MKVVHILKQIDIIDQDIKELKKLEKSVTQNKSFSTPIYMSIEKQINILLGQRIKLLELKVANPPGELVEQIEGEQPESKIATAKAKSKAKPKRTTKKPATPKKVKRNLSDDLPMLTQDMIDKKINDIKTEKKAAESAPPKKEKEKGDEDVKLLDIALEKGTLNKEDIEKEKEKKVRFFRENFPID